MAQQPELNLTRRATRRAVLRVTRRDFTRPVRRGAPIPEGASERVMDAAEDNRLARDADRGYHAA